MKLDKKQLLSIDNKIELPNGHIIVQLDYAGNKKIAPFDCNANIFCIDNNNNIIWQVSDSKGIVSRDSFMYIKQISSNKILAGRFFGKKYEIDVNSGVAEEVGWEK